MFGSLNGRIALVTGAMGGIGSAIAEALAEAGATVIGSGRAPQSKGDAWATGLRKGDGRIVYRTLDVTSEENWAALISDIGREFEDLDILVHNAGVAPMRKLEDFSTADYRKIIAANVDGVFFGTRAALPLMAATGAKRPYGASIVMISSASAVIGAPLHTAYSLSKGAVRVFAKACAIEFCALGHKVRVNTVIPAGVQTPLIDKIGQDFVDSGFGASIEEMSKLFTANHPIGRMAEPLDVAKVVRFVASDEAGYMQGSELVVDGGLTSQ